MHDSPLPRHDRRRTKHVEIQASIERNTLMLCRLCISGLAMTMAVVITVADSQNRGCPAFPTTSRANPIAGHPASAAATVATLANPTSVFTPIQSDAGPIEIGIATAARAAGPARNRKHPTANESAADPRDTPLGIHTHADAEIWCGHRFDPESHPTTPTPYRVSQLRGRSQSQPGLFDRLRSFWKFDPRACLDPTKRLEIGGSHDASFPNHPTSRGRSHFG